MPPHRSGGAALEREIAIPSTEDASETFQGCAWPGNGLQAGELFGRAVPADRFEALTGLSSPAGTASLGSSPTRDDFRTTRVGLPNQTVGPNFRHGRINT
jgi:hypothetical protein